MNAGDGVDAGKRVRSGILRRPGDDRDIGHIGRELDDDRLAAGLVLHGRRNLGREARILPEERAAVRHIGAGDIHFQGGNALFSGKALGKIGKFFGRSGVDIGDDRRFPPRQTGEPHFEKRLHPVVLQAHGVEHPAGGFRDAREGVALARPEGQPLDHNAPELRQIAVGLELHPVAECAGSREHRVLERQRSRGTGSLARAVPGIKKTYSKPIHA